MLVATAQQLQCALLYVNNAFAVKRELHPYGDTELFCAEGEDKSWCLPLLVEWHHDKAADVHYARIIPALATYHSQALTLKALLGPHDILGSTTQQWVIPRRMAEALLHKAPGISPRYYYRWPDPKCPPITKTIETLRLEMKEAQPRSLAHESFVQHLARERKISSSIINVVLTAIAAEAPAWMIEQKRPLDLGFCRLLAVPFRANWKELVAYKARVFGVKLAGLMRLPAAERGPALKAAGLPELLSSPHNIGLRRGWKANGESIRLDYTIEAIAGDKFDSAANAIEAKRQSRGSTGYVAEYEQTVESLYDYLVQAMGAYLRKVAAPFAQVCEGGGDGLLRFLPVSGRKIRVRDKALRNHPTHIVPPDSSFSVFGQSSDPRLIYSAPAPLPKVPDLLQAPADLRERTIDGAFELTDGEGVNGVSLPHAGSGVAPEQPMLVGGETAGDGVDGEGDSGEPMI